MPQSFAVWFASLFPPEQICSLFVKFTTVDFAKEAVQGIGKGRWKGITIQADLTLATSTIAIEGTENNIMNFLRKNRKKIEKTGCMEELRPHERGMTT